MTVHESTPAVLALDIGSSSARAALFDETGQLLEGTLYRVSYRLQTGPDGRAELEPLELAEQIERLLDTVHAVTPMSIRAVGISSFWHSLLGLDATGRPTTAVTMWADTRARDAARRLRQRLDPAEHHQRTGAYLHPSYPVARYVWVTETFPRVRAAAARWCAFPDFLLLRWTGVYRTSVSMASGTGLFDTWRVAWDEETCAAIGLDPAALPSIDDAAAHIAPDYAARWPRFAAAAWFPAWGDGACSNVGSGAVGEDRATIMIGTSSAVRALWRGEPLAVPWGCWLYRLDHRYVLAGGALSEGGDLVDWIRRRFVLPAEPELWERVQAFEPGSTGLVWIPTIAGERSPGWPVDATALLAGVRLSHDGVAILRAALEAVACRIADVVELLVTVKPELTCFIGSGNALVGVPGWAQIVADAVGRTLVLAPDPEASLRGAALVALTRLLDLPLEELARSEVGGWMRLTPDAAASARYRQYRERMKVLGAAVAALEGGQGKE